MKLTKSWQNVDRKLANSWLAADQKLSIQKTFSNWPAVSNQYNLTSYQVQLLSKTLTANQVGNQLTANHWLTYRPNWILLKAFQLWLPEQIHRSGF